MAHSGTGIEPWVRFALRHECASKNEKNLDQVWIWEQNGNRAGEGAMLPFEQSGSNPDREAINGDSQEWKMFKIQSLCGVMSTLVLATALYGCGNSGTEEPTGDKSGGKPSATSGPKAGAMKIAVIPKGTTHEFWKSVKAGAEDAGKELGVEISWKGPLKEDDRESEIKVVENFVTEGVQGIVVAPLDDTALVAPIESAIQSKIPVAIIDSALKSDKYVSFVATDNFKAGVMAGEEMVKQLGGKGRIVVLRLMAGSASTTEREEGFLSVVKKNPGIKVLSDNQYAGATIEKAQAASENLLAPYNKGDGLDLEGIFTPNESSCYGTLRTLQDAKWAGKIKFIGFDSSPKLIEGLKAGEINGLVVQNPRKMGYLGVKTLVQSIKGEKVDKRIDTGAVLVTKENLETPDIQKLVAPPQ